MLPPPELDSVPLSHWVDARRGCPLTQWTWDASRSGGCCRTPFKFAVNHRVAPVIFLTILTIKAQRPNQAKTKKGRTATRSGLTVMELWLPDRLELSSRHPNFVPREPGPSVVTPHRISCGGDSGNDAANEVVGNRVFPVSERY